MTVVKMIRPLDFKDYPEVPEHTQAALRRYVEQGLMPGSFLLAVLTNNLIAAVTHADSDNRRCLFEICRFVFNNLPSDCWGTADKVYEWVKPGIDARIRGRQHGGVEL